MAPPSGTSNDRTAVLRALGGRPALRGVGASTGDEWTGRGGGFPRKTAISWSMRCCVSSLDFFRGTFFVVPGFRSFLKANKIRRKISEKKSCYIVNSTSQISHIYRTSIIIYHLQDVHAKICKRYPKVSQ